MVDLNISQDYYKLLNVKRSSLTRVIQQAYKKKYSRIPQENKENIKDYFKTLDKALDVLTDIDKRSKYDAQWTYNFLKNYAWKNQELSEKDFKAIEKFWAKQHLNREVYVSLDFDNFIANYDLKWYVPFYEEAFWKNVKQKEEIYTLSVDSLYRKRYFYLILLVVAIFSFVSSIVFYDFFGIFLSAILALGSVSVFLAIIRPLIRVFKFINKDKTIENAKVVDKWVKVKPVFLFKRYIPNYFVAYETDYGIFYQKVKPQIFDILKKDMPVDVLISVDNTDQAMITKNYLKFLMKKAKNRN